MNGSANEKAVMCDKFLYLSEKRWSAVARFAGGERHPAHTRKRHAVSLAKSASMESRERGSRLGPWCGKCLQRAVAGIVGADAGTHFLEECANHAGSGAWGSWLERKNLETVERYLERRRQCVLVFSMAPTTNVVVAAYEQLSCMRNF